MTLIDVDGYLAPAELAVLGAAEAAQAIRRLDIGGSIGIDLPTDGQQGRAPGRGGGDRRPSCRSRSSAPRSTASASSRSSGRGRAPRWSSWRRTAPRSKRARCFDGRRSKRPARSASSLTRPSSPCSTAHTGLARSARPPARRRNRACGPTPRSPCPAGMPTSL